MTTMDEAIAAYTDAANQIGVLSITTQSRYVILRNALRGFGNLDDARYNFAMEATLLADAHKQWKLAADGLEREIALDPPDLTLNPETGEHDDVPYQNADGTPIHPGCACETAHPDNVLYEETIQALECADDDAAAVRAYYNGTGR